MFIGGILTIEMNIRYVLGEVIFWLHLPIVLLWLGLFFVPERLVPGKTVFHFWFIIGVFSAQVLWGLVMLSIRKRFGAGVCPLTTLNQWVRGFSITDERNYDHTFIQEFLERVHIRLAPLVTYSILFGTLALITIQYFSIAQ